MTNVVSFPRRISPDWSSAKWIETERIILYFCTRAGREAWSIGLQASLSFRFYRVEHFKPSDEADDVLFVGKNCAEARAKAAAVAGRLNLPLQDLTAEQERQAQADDADWRADQATGGAA